MALTTAMAVGLGAAALSAGGSVLAAKSASKASGKAADIAQQSAAEANALQREIYGYNTANLSPFMQRGNAAGNALSGLLLGPQGVPQQQMQQTGQYGAPQPVNALSGYSPANGMPPDYYPWDDANMYGMSADQAWAQQQVPPGMPQPAPQTVNTALPAQPVQNPWDQFRNSTNYQFRLGEGLKGLNQGYAARGMLESGAAMKGINNYAQQFASNELGNYMNMLSGQQQTGLSGANALAGVGTNMANAVNANSMSGASVMGNAALINGQQQGAMYGNIANAFGNFADQFGSSYQKQPVPATVPTTGRWR